MYDALSTVKSREKFWTAGNIAVIILNSEQ